MVFDYPNHNPARQLLPPLDRNALSVWLNNSKVLCFFQVLPFFEASLPKEGAGEGRVSSAFVGSVQQAFLTTYCVSGFWLRRHTLYLLWHLPSTCFESLSWKNPGSRSTAVTKVQHLFTESRHECVLWPEWAQAGSGTQSLGWGGQWGFQRKGSYTLGTEDALPHYLPFCVAPI